MSDELPPYEPAQAAPVATLHSCMAGPVQTCSIEDMQHDYFHLIQDTPTSYTLRLTVGTTPLYRIEISSDPASTADIFLYPAFTTDTPIAAARIAPRSEKILPPVTICTSAPTSASARYNIGMRKSSSLMPGENYHTKLPIVTVPGIKPVMRDFGWKFARHSADPDMELWQSEVTGYGKTENLDREQIFARYYKRGHRVYGKNILILRRGGGLDFEYAAVLGVAALNYLQETRR
jgi:hypothetical protein